MNIKKLVAGVAVLVFLGGCAAQAKNEFLGKYRFENPNVANDQKLADLKKCEAKAEKYTEINWPDTLKASGITSLVLGPMGPPLVLWLTYADNAEKKARQKDLYIWCMKLKNYELAKEEEKNEH